MQNVLPTHINKKTPSSYQYAHKHSLAVSLLSAACSLCRCCVVVVVVRRQVQTQYSGFQSRQHNVEPLNPSTNTHTVRSPGRFHGAVHKALATSSEDSQ